MTEFSEEQSVEETHRVRWSILINFWAHKFLDTANGRTYTQALRRRTGRVLNDHEQDVDKRAACSLYKPGHRCRHTGRSRGITPQPSSPHPCHSTPTEQLAMWQVEEGKRERGGSERTPACRHYRAPMHESSPKFSPGLKAERLGLKPAVSTQS